MGSGLIRGLLAAAALSVLAVAAVVVSAQGQPADPVNRVAPPPAPPAAADAPPASDDSVENMTPAPQAKAVIPEGPPKPVRSPIAILRVLDKVTAETLMFEAPVGKHVRYKSLIFTVKACETRSPGAAQPRPSAYVVIESQPDALPGRPLPPSRQVFKGWMFAAGPGLHPFEHPVYDAWLDACSDVPAPA